MLGLRRAFANAWSIRVRPEWRERVAFQRLNLMEDFTHLPKCSVIFCRNVMIYFDAPTQRRVLQQMHRVLRPDGLLFVGHSENFTDSRDLFRLRGKTVDAKVVKPTAMPAAMDMKH